MMVSRGSAVVAVVLFAVWGVIVVVLTFADVKLRTEGSRNEVVMLSGEPTN